MLFAGRRLGAEGIAVLASVRTGPGQPRRSSTPGWSGWRSARWSPADARTLLERAQGARLAVPVAERLVDGAAGNPLALLEIPTLLSDAQLAGREPLESPLRPGTGIKRAFRRRVDLLPDDARRALLVAAASESSAVDAILGGMRAIGLGEEALEPAEAADLIRVAAGRLDFRHPLLRSTAYYAASAAERRAVHRALAAVAEEGSAERAWHLASATVAPEEDVAAALEAAALDARRRGAPGTAARDFARAAQLSPADEPRARRLLEAAADAGAVGEGVQALAYLRRGRDAHRRPARAVGDPPPPGERPHPHRARPGRLPRARRRGRRRARHRPAARGRDVPRGVRLPHEHRRHVVADRHRRPRARARRGSRAGAGAAVGAGDRRGVPRARREQAPATSCCGIAEPFLLGGDLMAAPAEVLGMAGHSSIWIESFDRAEAVLARLVRTYRDASAVVSLIYPLAARAHLDLRRGRWSQAVAEAAESLTLAEQTGQVGLTSFSLATQALVLAHLGREAGDARGAGDRDRRDRAHAGRRDPRLRRRRARAPRAQPRARRRGRGRAGAARRADRAARAGRAGARDVAART